MSPFVYASEFAILLLQLLTVLISAVDQNSFRSPAQGLIRECGLRYTPFRANETIESSTFPWLVTVTVGDQLATCPGALVSGSVALTSASCLASHPEGYVTVTNSVGKSFNGRQAIVHPDFNVSHPSAQHDLVLIKFELDDNEHFVSPACIPEIGDDPVQGCQIAEIKSNGRILAKDIAFAPSIRYAN